MRILIIEDDPDLADAIKEAFTNHYTIDVSFNGQDGIGLTKRYNYDLILLDLGLLDINGLTVCSRLRKSKIKTPILIITGESDTKEKVTALDSGADDYLVKPFDLEELGARIRALLRRGCKDEITTIITLDDLEIDVVKRTVKRNNLSIKLDRKDFELLEYLSRNKGVVVTRNMILDHLWSDPSQACSNIVDVHIKYLRDKIDRPFSNKLIKTVYGVGYKIEPLTQS